jgi:hypothetical protein
LGILIAIRHSAQSNFRNADAAVSQIRLIH